LIYVIIGDWEGYGWWRGLAVYVLVSINVILYVGAG